MNKFIIWFKDKMDKGKDSPSKQELEGEPNEENIANFM